MAFSDRVSAFFVNTYSHTLPYLASAPEGAEAIDEQAGLNLELITEELKQQRE